MITKEDIGAVGEAAMAGYDSGESPSDVYSKILDWDALQETIATAQMLVIPTFLIPLIAAAHTPEDDENRDDLLDEAARMTTEGTYSLCGTMFDLGFRLGRLHAERNPMPSA